MSDILETLADPTRPHDAVRVARERLNEGDLDDADRVVRFALDFNPADAGLLHVRADIAARRGQYDTAVAWLEKAIEAKPGDLGLRNRMIALHQDQNNLVAASEAAEQALAIVPDD